MRNPCVLLVTRSRPWFVLASLLILMCPTMHGQSSPAQKSRPQTTVTHAVWTSGLETDFGISQTKSYSCLSGLVVENRENPPGEDALRSAGRAKRCGGWC